MTIDVKVLALISTFGLAALAMFEIFRDKRGFALFRIMAVLTMMRIMLWIQTH